MGDTYEIHDPEAEAALRKLARIIDRKTPNGYGFALLLFTLEPGATFYISNAERTRMLAAMQEFIRSNKERGY